eukprot:4644744-Prymnesium_polylepis.1
MEHAPATCGLSGRESARDTGAEARNVGDARGLARHDAAGEAGTEAGLAPLNVGGGALTGCGRSAAAREAIVEVL